MQSNLIETGLSTRLQLERDFIKNVCTYGECWPDQSGIYKDSQHSLINQHRIPSPLYQKIVQEPEIPNFHNRLSKFAKELLQNNQSDRPVLLLDIGGGDGATWKITASDFEEEIKAGKIAFIVSNLAWPIKQFKDSANIDHEHTLVHYINSTFRRLCTQSIILPNGRTLYLRNNLDLIHECQSLTRWSQVPELDILSVLGLLSGKGTYFIAPFGTPCEYTRATNYRDNKRQRELAVNQTHNWLQTKTNLIHIPQVESGEYEGAYLLYNIFRQPEAPLVTI